MNKQLNHQNIITEYFSEFTSRCVVFFVILSYTFPLKSNARLRYPAIRDAQLDFLICNCNNPMVTGALPNWCEEIAKGSLPDCAEALQMLLSKLMGRY